MAIFWFPLLVTIIGGLVVWWVISLILKSRKKHQENIVYKFLKNNTNDKGGEQFLKIDFVAKELAIPPTEIKSVVENSSKIFFHPNDNQKIGIYELKSIYEDRGIVTV